MKDGTDDTSTIYYNDAPSQMTSALMCRSEGEAESLGARPLRAATREARYIELMRTMQFGEDLHSFY